MRSREDLAEATFRKYKEELDKTWRETRNVGGAGEREEYKAYERTRSETAPVSSPAGHTHDGEGGVPLPDTVDRFALPETIRQRAVVAPKPGMLAFAHKWKPEYSKKGSTLYERILNEWPAFITFGVFTMFLPHAARFPHGFPTHWQLTGYAALYCTGGQIFNNGDTGFASSLITATGLSHVVYFGRRAFKAHVRSPAPLYLTYLAMTNVAIYTPAALKYAAGVLLRRETLAPRETIRILAT